MKDVFSTNPIKLEPGDKKWHEKTVDTTETYAHSESAEHSEQALEDGLALMGEVSPLCEQVRLEASPDEITSSVLQEAGTNSCSYEHESTISSPEIVGINNSAPVYRHPNEQSLSATGMSHGETGLFLLPERCADSSSSVLSFYACPTETPMNRGSQGARPKITATRRKTNNSKPKSGKKRVTWSSETKEIIDETTFISQRNCLLNLRIPLTNYAEIAVKSVLFMSHSSENISRDLAIMVMNLGWLKHHTFPTAQQLYSAITEINYDERACVSEFIELCKTERGGSVVKSLLDSVDYHLPLNADTQYNTHENFPSKTVASTPLPGDSNYSLQNDNLHAEKSEQGSESFYTHESLEVTVPATAFQLEENSSYPQLPSAAGHTGLQFSYTEPKPNKTHPGKQQNVPLAVENLQQTQVRVLQTEQTYLKADLTCVLCRKKPREVTFLPCGHFALCAACSESLNTCPVCNKQALAEVKTFLS